MTDFPGISRIAAITLTAALSMTAGLAWAADNDVSADQIVNALQPPKTLTRSLSADWPADPSVQAKEDGFVDSVRNRTTRSLSLGEREEIAELATAKPKIDSIFSSNIIPPGSARPRCPPCRNSARRCLPPN